MICKVCWGFFFFHFFKKKFKKNEIASNVFLGKGKLNDIWEFGTYLEKVGW